MGIIGLIRVIIDSITCTIIEKLKAKIENIKTQQDFDIAWGRYFIGFRYSKKLTKADEKSINLLFYKKYVELKKRGKWESEGRYDIKEGFILPEESD